MITLTRPEGTQPDDLNISRRGLAAAAFGGYAVYAFSADAAPITTDANGLVTETVNLPGQDRPVPAYLARPDAPGRFPVVMVISEVFGVHEYIRDVCRRFAKLGYVALAPDFFFRAGDPSTTNDFDKIRAIVAKASDAQLMSDLNAAALYLKAAPFADKKKWAIMGFCWGGAIAWLACERYKEFKAGSAWYGRLSRPRPGEFLGEPERVWPNQLVGSLSAPVIGFYGGKDQGIPVSEVEFMRELLKAYKKRGSEIIVYPEAQHGFHADYRTSYDEKAAKDAWDRMLAHFARNGVAPRPFA
jgi:carboxymethylenebutenolidase